MPLLHALPLIVLYGGLASIVGTIPGLEDLPSTTWVLLGALIYSTFVGAYLVFRNRFIEEKYWMTIHGILISPASKYYMLFGVIIETAVRGLVTAGIFFILAYITFPTALLNFLLAFLIFIIGLVAGVGISLLNGTVHLINENYTIFFDYFLYIIVFLSTYSITMELYPNFLQPIININPLYQIIQLTRIIWAGEFTINLIWPIIYVILFAVASVLLGVYFFTKMTRRFGVHGY